MAVIEILTWREIQWSTTDLVGFEVDATDGKIGKVDETTRDVQMHGFVVVDTGPWIFNRTKDEIKNAPEFDEKTFHEDPYRGSVSSYYTDLDRTTTR